jgi:hypothetical protein
VVDVAIPLVGGKRHVDDSRSGGLSSGGGTLALAKEFHGPGGRIRAP